MPPGAIRRLNAERGKVVVLNFWATWCGPRHEEMPVFGRVYADLRKAGLEMFAITDESAEEVRQFVANNPMAIRSCSTGRGAWWRTSTDQ